MSNKSKIERLSDAINWLRTSRIILSQAEFAEKIGIKPSQISEMINGKRPISERTIHNVVDSFPDLNFEWLYRGDGDMIKKPEPPTEDPAQNVSDNVIIPREAWEVIRNQAASLKAKDDQMSEMIAGYKEKDRQINDVIAMLKEQMKKGEGVGDYGHAAPGAALG